MINDASVGDDVLTTGGIYGTITEAEGDDVVVEIASGISVHMTRRGIAAVLPPEEDVEDDDDFDEVEDDDDVDEADEGAVTDGEEAVRSTASDVSNGDERR
jgi:preprotein translocase subunit YajC